MKLPAAALGSGDQHSRAVGFGASLAKDDNGRWRPFREVVHIRDGVGQHGGEFWHLRLSCGHTKAVRKRVIRGWKLASFKAESFLAPKRVRCLFCQTQGPT